MSADFHTFCERLLSATANGVYQGLVITLAADLALRWLGRTNAATRHAVWFGVLLLVAALIPAHLLRAYAQHDSPQMKPFPPASIDKAVAPALSAADKTQDASVDGDVFPASEPDDSDSSNLSCVAPSPATAVASEPPSGVNDLMSPLEVLPAPKTNSPFLSVSPRPWLGKLETAIALPHPVCLALVFAWLLLASVRCAQVVSRIREVRRIKQTSYPPSHCLQELFERMSAALAGRRDVRLRISSQHRTAVVLGFVHPVVLLPSEMAEETQEDEVAHVLRHELAHVDRCDDWANLTQQIIQVPLFFHPAVWWISSKLSLEREIACDDHVLDSSAHPRAYALTLANAASRINRCQRLLAPGVSSNNSQLQKRITMILNTQRNRSPRLAKSRVGILTIAAALLAVLAINAGPRLVLAETPPTPPESTTDADNAAASADNAAASADNAAASADNAAASADNAAASADNAIASADNAVASADDAVASADDAVASADDANSASTSVGLSPDGPDIDSGPKIKVAAAGNGDSQSAPVAVLVAPVPPTGAVPPAPPQILALAPAAPAPPEAPEPAEPPSPRHGKRHMSVEERLDHIEKVLEELQAQDHPKAHHASANGTSKGAGMSSSGAAYSDDAAVYKHAAEDSQRIAEVQERAAEAAQRAVEKAQRDMEKLKSKDMVKLQEQLRDIEADGPARELQALRDARQTLDKEIENLSRQIKRLEVDQQDQQKKRAERSASEGSDNGPRPE